MQRAATTSVCVVISMGLQVCTAIAGPFTNLNFESSSYTASSPPSITAPTSLLFPSWTVRINDTIQTTGLLNVYVLAGAQSVLVVSDTPTEVLEGTKSLYLGGWIDNTSASIAQTGDIPAGSQSLRFLARGSGAALPGPLDLTVNGQSVPLVALSSANPDFVYGADISTWAGTSAELRLFVTGFGASGYDGWAMLDDISFSTSPIPEPTSVLLLSPLAMFGLAHRKANGRKKSSTPRE